MRRSRSRSAEIDDIAVDGLVGRVAAYSTQPPAADGPPEPASAPPVREYPHPASDRVRVVPMLGSLDERTLALLQSVVTPGADAPRRVVVLQLEAGTVATREALRELADAHARAAAAGNWIVLVCADDAVRAALERLAVPGGPRIGTTNADAMRLALDVVAAGVCAA